MSVKVLENTKENGIEFCEGCGKGCSTGIVLQVLKNNWKEIRIFSININCYKNLILSIMEKIRNCLEKK